MTNKLPILTIVGLTLFLVALQALAIPWTAESKAALAQRHSVEHLSVGEQKLESRRHKKNKSKEESKFKHSHDKSNRSSPRTYNTDRRAKAPKNPTDAFCKEFLSRCYDVAMQGRTQGKVEIIHSCQRNGDQYSKSYSFGCKVDGVVRTNDVLGSTEGGFTVTVTTAGTTEIITATATQETTTSSTSTHTALTTETDEYTTATTTTPTTSITDTITTSTTTTVASPVTYTSVTTLTSTITSIATSTVSTSTLSLVNEGSLGTLTLLQVAVPTDTPIRKRVMDVSSSDFCSEFADGCVSVCQQNARSPARHIVCQQDSLNQQSGQEQYSLSCVCLNGKSETQHALAYAAEQKHVDTVSTVATQTVTTTLQATETIPVEVLTTLTISSEVTNTATLTSVSTVRQTSIIILTKTNTTPTTIATAVPTLTSLTTTTSTTSVTATSTTEIVLAPTGAVEVLDLYTDTSYGKIGNSPAVSGLYGPVSSNAYSFMAIADPGGSDLVQLKLGDGSGNVWTSVLFFTGGTPPTDLAPSNPDATVQASKTGCNSQQAGPPSVNEPCETFIFKLLSLDASSPTPSFNLTGYWVNSAQTPSQAGIQYWDLDVPNSVLQFTGDPVGAKAYTNFDLHLVYLRFPVPA